MAKIVLGLGTSHGPMLSTPPEEWGQRAIFDRQIRHHYRGETWSFAELVELRRDQHVAREITLERWRVSPRHSRRRNPISSSSSATTTWRCSSRLRFRLSASFGARRWSTTP